MFNNSNCQIVQWSIRRVQTDDRKHRSEEPEINMTSDQRCKDTMRGEGGGGNPVIIHYLGHGLYNIP